MCPFFCNGNEDKVKTALGDAGLSTLLNDKDISLDTILSKEFANGVELSGGQWQKIALAVIFIAMRKLNSWMSLLPQ